MIHVAQCINFFTGISPCIMSKLFFIFVLSVMRSHTVLLENILFLEKYFIKLLWFICSATRKDLVFSS